MKNHPYHYYSEKNVIQRLIDLALPAGLFWAYFRFYNFGKITPSELIKTSGLLAISLLSFTLIIGPLCRFFPGLSFLKAHRKFWGISSFLAGLIHTFLVFNYYFKLDFSKFVDTNDPKFLGILAGLAALSILFLVSFTSIKQVLYSLDPKVWKAIQTTSYLALILALSHFYLMEAKEGVLVIKRLLGQITFAFATLTVLVRLIVQFLPKK